MTSFNSKPERKGEFALIADLFAPLAAKAPLAYGLTDDAAVLRPLPGRDVVTTVDALVEGVHFLKSDPADDIARKALRVNLSDLAAKGARAEFYLLSLSVAPWVDDEWLGRFVQGLGSDQEKFGVMLIGGDTTATPGPLTLSITAFGTVPSGRMIRRAGAAAGDCVFVSGTIGDAGGGLAVLRGEGDVLAPADRQALIARYRVPEPRLALGVGLLGFATAALDVSDGLIADLGHIADVSKVAIAIEAAQIPLSPALIALFGDDQAAMVRAATAGDDYEIAFTASAANRSQILALGEALGVALSEIGRVEAGEGVRFLGPDGAAIPLDRTGYRHF